MNRAFWRFFLGPLLSLAVGLWLYRLGWPREGLITAAITTLCAVWWVNEALPIPITSLLPLGLFPLLGVLDGSQVAQAYGHPLIILLMAGAMLSKAMEKSGAHRRLALSMVQLFGGASLQRLVLGFMCASALLSMWISNTATALMLLPVALAVLDQDRSGRLATPLLLGIAYGASIGGIATPIGTPPNVVMMSIYQSSGGERIGFVEWMGWGLPVVLALLPAAGWWLTRALREGASLSLPAVGQWQAAERRVLGVFALTALGWITLSEPFGGWSGWFELPTANYASVAIVGVLLLAMLPDGKGERLLDWESASGIHWGVLLLFAGGLTIARAFTESGLSSALGQQLASLIDLPLWVVVLCLCLGVTFLTEITSNTATTTLLMPVLAATASAQGLDARLLMVPAAISASCAFMLPVATAPNAIVFGSGRLTVKTMAREGFAINLMGAALIAGLCLLLL